jgi:drug/metabolite transporter (DMT)-like permease
VDVRLATIVALSAQLITMETLFGTIFGLLVRHRRPTLAESFGMTLLLIGVLAVIRIVYGQQVLKLDRRSA